MKSTWLHIASSRAMFSKHGKKKSRLVIKLTKPKNSQLEKFSEAVTKSIKNELFHWQFLLVSLATVILAFSIAFL